MPKRSAECSDTSSESDDYPEPTLRNTSEVDPENQDESSDDEAVDTINVDFDFYNPKPIDFHATKRFLGQLFATDVESIHTSQLSDVIIEQGNVGTMVKVDGEDSDPFAMLTVISLNDGNKELVKQVKEFILRKCSAKKFPVAQKKLSAVFGSEKKIGWLISERLINMPPQIMPPSYRMLAEEIQQARDGGRKSFEFDYYLMISQTYREVESQAEELEEESPSSSSTPPAPKKTKPAPSPALFHFHAEEEVVKEFAECEFHYKPPQRESSRVTDAMRVFQEHGIAPERIVYLIAAKKFHDMVRRMKDYVEGSN